MDESTSPTSDISTALTPAVGADTSAASTLAGDTGVGTIASQALDQATPAPDNLDQILSGIPADDTDLAAYQGQQSHQALVSQREQLRVLSSAVRELTPLKAFQQFGDPTAIQPRLELANLLYSPLLRDGRPVYDPATKTPYTTTKPFVEHLDKTSPGMPEQLLVDLLNLVTENPSMLDTAGSPIKEPLVNQVWRYFRLDPRRLPEYQNIDALIARTSGAVTPEELAEIPAEYHAAYRSIPPSIRNAWASYDAADQTKMLEDYKGKVDDAAEKVARRAADERAKAVADQRYALEVAAAQDKYLDTIRRERTTSMIQSLAQQVTFSADPITNQVLLGSLAATMAQLLDPAWRFVVIDNVLTPLGLKLDHTFDEALTKFDTNAADSVAVRMAGDIGRADQLQADANSAANQLMAKVAIFALKVAAKQGATVAEKATVLSTSLAAAATGRPGTGNGSAPATTTGILPPGMRPGTREATEFIARSTGLFPPAA